MSELPDAVQRLAASRGAQGAFLEPHHVETARRVSQLFERARLRQRVTMSYDPARVGGRGSGGGGAQADLSASAADARQRLAELARTMPAECWSIVFDVCGLDMGLGDIETRRDWPRRGGKLVLRIALSLLAERFGLLSVASGQEAARQRGWLAERPAMFAEGGS